MQPHPRPPGPDLADGLEGGQKLIQQSSSIPETAVARSDKLLLGALAILGAIAIMCLVAILVLTINGQESSITLPVLSGIVTTVVGAIAGLLSPIGR